MNRFLLILFFIISTSYSLFCNNLGSLNLKGKVKTLISKSYQILPNNEKIMTGKYKYSFNVDGNYLFTEFYDQDDLLQFYTEFKYSQDGQLLEALTYDNVNDKPLRDVYEYSNNLCIGSSKYSEDGECIWMKTYEYDSDNKKIKEVSYNDKGNKKSEKYFSYINSLLVEENEYDPTNKLITKQIMRYNNRKLIIETDKTNNSGITTTTKYFYDSKQNLKKIECFENGKKNSSSIYTLDKQGNAIEVISTTIYNNVQLKYFSTYEIEYYWN